MVKVKETHLYFNGVLKIKRKNKFIYREIQQPRSLLFWIANLAVSSYIWYIFIQQIFFGVPIGDKPLPDVMLIIFWLIFCVILPVVLLFFSKLVIEIREDGIYVRYLPFHFRYKQFLFENIKHYETINYSPLKHFGGWGIRINIKGDKAYIVSGNNALKLRMKNETLVIGTRKPDALKKAMDSLTKRLK